MDKFLFYSLNIFFRGAVILLELLPYLAVGILAGEALRYCRLHRFAGRLSTKSPFLSTLAAAVLGIVSPLCTYGTVPVVMSLNRAGVPVWMLTVFLISSSMMNPQLFMLTAGGIGIEMAMMRILTIIVFALLMGWILRLLPQSWVLNKKSLEELKSVACEGTSPERVFTWRGYLTNVLKTLEHMGFYIVTGVLLAAAIEVLVPASFANRLFQQARIIQILLMAALSIPFYTCGGGVIPIVRSLIEEGMSRGSALAFLNVGSATRVTVIMALAAFVRPAFIFVYILILMIFSVLTGYIYN